MTFRLLLRAVVPGVVALTTGEPEALDLVRTAERVRRDSAEQRTIGGTSRSEGMLSPPGECARSASLLRQPLGLVEQALPPPTP